MCLEFAGRCSLWEQAPVLLAEEAFPFQIGADAGEQLRVDRFPSCRALLGVQAHRRLLDGDARACQHDAHQACSLLAARPLERRLTRVMRATPRGVSHLRLQIRTNIQQRVIPPANLARFGTAGRHQRLKLLIRNRIAIGEQRVDEHGANVRLDIDSREVAGERGDAGGRCRPKLYLLLQIHSRYLHEVSEEELYPRYRTLYEPYQLHRDVLSKMS